MTEGSYTITAKAIDDEGAASVSNAVQITVRTAPNVHPIPGKIEAEDYADMMGVQINTTTDTDGGMNVGWIENGERIDYPVHVQKSGAYRVEIRMDTRPVKIHTLGIFAPNLHPHHLPIQSFLSRLLYWIASAM